MSLLQLQRAFAARLRARQPQPWRELGVDAAPGLAVYHHAYRAQLRHCLRDTYAKTLAWMGDADFDAAADAYLQAHPPSARSLGDYGGDFPLLLRERHGAEPWLEELAWLDHALARAFSGPEAPALDLRHLADLDWDRATFRFVPTLRLRHMETNAAALWRALSDSTAPPPPVRLAEPQALRLWRQDGSPRFSTLPSTEAAALQLALAGLPFGPLCNSLGGDDPAVPGQLLGQWLRDGLICAVEQAPERDDPP